MVNKNRQSRNQNVMKNNLLALLGAAIGGALGYLGFGWMLTHGFYAMILPGGLVGLGASLFRSRSLALCYATGLGALALGLFTEWSYLPFKVDKSLGYFLSNVRQLNQITLIMIGIGAVLGFILPRNQRSRILQEGKQPTPF